MASPDTIILLIVDLQCSHWEEDPGTAPCVCQWN